MAIDRCRVAVIAVAVGVFAASLGAEAALSRKLSDKKPHEGVADAHTMPVQGIDVSYWQGDIDWQKVGDAGIHFAYIKATEGGDRVDPKFLDNWRAAKQAGVARGAYHFMYWCRAAKDQASWFMLKVPVDDDALPPVLDVEWNSHSKTCPHRIARKTAIAKIKIMLEAMEAYSGKQPIIYTDPKFHREVLEGEFPNHHFWLRSVAAKPEEKYRGAQLGVLAVHHHRARARRHRPGRPQQLQRYARRLEARAEEPMHLRDRSINVFERLVRAGRQNGTVVASQALAGENCVAPDVGLVEVAIKRAGDGTSLANCLGNARNARRWDSRSTLLRMDVPKLRLWRWLPVNQGSRLVA